MSKEGHASLYKEEYAEIAEKICRIYGSTDLQMAEFFEVSDATINNWKNKHPLFFNHLMTGKEEFDTNNVEASVLDSALGYETVKIVEKTCAFCGDIETTKTTKQVKSVMAGIFWLRNRRANRWNADTKNPALSSGEPEVILIEATVEKHSDGT